jgi:hypothetical protein
MQFKKYMGAKPPSAIPNLSKQNIFRAEDVVTNRMITPELV